MSIFAQVGNYITTSIWWSVGLLVFTLSFFGIVFYRVKTSPPLKVPFKVWRIVLPVIGLLLISLSLWSIIYWSSYVHCLIDQLMPYEANNICWRPVGRSAVRALNSDIPGVILGLGLVSIFFLKKRS